MSNTSGLYGDEIPGPLTLGTKDLLRTVIRWLKDKKNRVNRRHSYHPGGLLNKEKAMSTEPGQVQDRSSSPEAERMRLYRKRRREGMRYVRVPLHVTEVDALIRIGRLKEDSRTDAEVGRE